MTIAYVATSEIGLCRFVKESGFSPSGHVATVAQCGTGDRPLGISALRPRSPTTEYRRLAALPGEPCPIHQEFAEAARLELGCDVSYRDQLKPDDCGRGVLVERGETGYAMAIQSGKKGEIIDVKVIGI